MSLTKLNMSSYYPYDMAFGVDYSFRLFLLHKPNQDGGYYCIYDFENEEELFILDFSFDVSCDLNRCISLNDEAVVFIKYAPEKDEYYNYTYDILEGVWFLYEEEYNGIGSDNSLTLKVNIWGEEVVIS